MVRSLKTPIRTTFQPVEALLPELIPAELAAPPDVSTKVFRHVRLPHRVPEGERIRANSVGFTSRQIGTVLKQVDLDDGNVAALICLYRAELGPPDLEAELVVQIDESAIRTEVPLRPSDKRENIFDFTEPNE